MTFETSQLTHGAINFYKQIIERAVVNGWTRTEDINDRGQLGAAVVINRATDAIDFDATGLSTGIFYELPVMYLGVFTALKNFTTPVTEGIDYDISRVRGRIKFRPGGLFDAGAGVATGHFTLSAGYEIKKGWTILTSPGLNGSETIAIGARFDSLNGAPDNPIRCGPRWTVFKSWSVGISNYDSVSLAERNAAVDDVMQYINPKFDFEWQASFSLDRIICAGTSGGYTAWTCIGGMRRVRPNIEQTHVTGMIGNQGNSQNGDAGPVGDTAATGTMSAQHGSVYLYDLGVFSSVANPVELNANNWSLTAGSISAGYTPSRRLLNSPAPGGTSQYYDELHNVIVGRNNMVPDSVTNVMYGLWEGLKTCLLWNPNHDYETTLGGTTFRIIQVGNSNSRFIAVAKT